MPWRLCDLPKYPAALTTKPQPIPFPHFGPVFLGTGAAAISGRFSAPLPPRKRSSRPSLSLYLDFPLTSTLTLAASDPLPSLPFTSPGTSTSAGIGNVGGGDDGGGGGDDDGGGGDDDGRLRSVCSVGVARAHARADDDGSDTALGGRRFTVAAAVWGWWAAGAAAGRRRGRWLCS